MERGTESKTPKYFYFKAKYFQAFHYIYKLARDCKSRIENVLKNNDRRDEMTDDVFIKIGIVGKFTDADLKLISTGRVTQEIPNDGKIWAVRPLVCFHPNLSLLSGFEGLHILDLTGSNAILIIKCKDNESDKGDNSHFKDDDIKNQLIRIITIFLNKPLREMLEGWLENLGTEDLSKQVAGIKAEIEAICKQMEFDDGDESAAVSVPIVYNKSHVPDDVKEYLFRSLDVSSFGLWRSSSFKVFVKKNTHEERLKDDLMNLSPNFFAKYHLEIEKRKMVMKQTLKQETHQPAYMEDDQNLKEIGFCVFTTREKSCDFAAIEIKEALANECDIALRREDKKKTNAKVNTKRLENVGIVHKIGKATDVTTGLVLSPEYYDKEMDDSNREYLFLVKGTSGKFSEDGDSGSLVFCRPRSVQQTHIDILGMVYANNLTVDDDDQEEDDDHGNDERTKSSPSEGTVELEVNAETASCKSLSFKTDSIASADNAQDPEHISCCYRIDTALKLFEDHYCGQLKVKFQDDLSQLSNSDDSNEET
ncbi:uncharacterized protein [Magallana gigas]|uniref:uncharacterized protein isoform X3 n=1 Tax=Magallana gigas TaxID=29159 RepID=UPI00333FF1A9